MPLEDTSSEFQASALRLKQFEDTPSNKDLLILYGYFKQATEGDITVEQPTTYDFKTKFKWQSWKSQQGASRQQAEKRYIEKVELLAKEHEHVSNYNENNDNNKKEE